MKEPFVLLYPGAKVPPDPATPVMVSPLIGNPGNIVVAYADTSVKTVHASRLDEILRSREAVESDPPQEP